MKKFLSICAVVICCVALVGCGKEVAKKTIVGDWVYTEGGYTYHFNEDGTGTYMGSMNFSYTEKDGTIELQFDGTDNKLTGTWSEDTLTMKDVLDNDIIYNRK